MVMLINTFSYVYRIMFSNYLKKDYFFKKNYHNPTNLFLNWNLLDFFYLSTFSLFYKFNQLNFINNKISQIKLNYFANNSNNKLLGLKSFWHFSRFWILSTILFILSFYYLMIIRSLPFTKLMFEYLLLTMFFYWLISGFVFFIKKYQYSKFTSVIQRFWRRSYILFWMLEFFLFLVFFYLTINSNQEPVYMYDHSQVFKTHFFSWKLFLLKLIPLVLIIFLCYFVLLSMKWNTFSKINLYLFFITLLILYLVWTEFYQFFHILAFYGNLFWVYDVEEHLWNLEVEFRRTRMSNHYVTICLIAKFWHVIFVLIFWLFFVLRSFELSRVRYPMFSANLQNFIMLYIMTWVYMYPWFKFIFRKFLDMPYYWFYVNNRRLFLFSFFNDIKLYFFSFDRILNFTQQLYSFSVGNFFYWIATSNNVGYDQYKKNFIRDMFIQYI